MNRTTKVPIIAYILSVISVTSCILCEYNIIRRITIPISLFIVVGTYYIIPRILDRILDRNDENKSIYTRICFL